MMRWAVSRAFDFRIERPAAGFSVGGHYVYHHAPAEIEPCAAPPLRAVRRMVPSAARCNSMSAALSPSLQPFMSPATLHHPNPHPTERALTSIHRSTGPLLPLPPTLSDTLTKAHNKQAKAGGHERAHFEPHAREIDCTGRCPRARATASSRRPREALETEMQSVESRWISMRSARGRRVKHAHWHSGRERRARGAERGLAILDARGVIHRTRRLPTRGRGLR